MSRLKIKLKYWKYFICLVCVLVLVFPLSSTFENIDEINAEWKGNYVLNTIEYAIVIIPIIVLLIFIPRLEKGIAKRILIIFLILLAICSFLFALLTIVLPIQDLFPEFGVGLLLILSPIVLIDSWIEWKRE